LVFDQKRKQDTRVNKKFNNYNLDWSSNIWN